MRIGILGPLEVRDEAGRPIEVGGPRVRALLVRLAIDPGRAVATERLADDLWPAGPPNGGNALQTLVSRLRGAIGRQTVVSGRGGYRLLVERADVDAVAFEQRVIAARAVFADGDTARAAAELRGALDLWRGPALLDVADADFAHAAIARLEELHTAATEDRIDADIALGRASELVPELEELTARHPLRERQCGQYMRALYAAGRQAEAFAVYEETRRTLAERLGVDPSPELADVHLAILRRDPELGVASGAGGPSPRGESSTVPSRRTNVPAPLTSFVGREEEVARVGKLLHEARLVTLTGPGGAGKTRLATEAVVGLTDSAPDGVWFVPLASVSDPADVAQSVLVALGAAESVRLLGAMEPREVPAIRPSDRLVDVLSEKRLLVVLDNCEHLLDAVARLVDRVLAVAPGVRVLATSREPLGITGETLCPVPSLPLPPEDATAADAMNHASVRLFADRAGAVRPGFTVDSDTVEPVVRICRALDGIPLAIELAAARLRSLTPVQVADRLDDRFTLLASGSRTALPRHRTLRAIVDWSWDLLDDTERAVLRRLSVFAGGAVPEAVERVCAPADEPGDIIDVVASLVDKSLVVATGDAEVRYRLLETVRAYAGQRLAEAGEEERVRAAHAAYFVELAERAEPELRGRDQLRWSERLTAEHDNCVAALHQAMDADDAPTGLRLIGALAWFWLMRDYEATAAEWAMTVRGMAGDTAPPGLTDAYAICAILALLGDVMADEESPASTTFHARVRELASLVPEETDHPVLRIVGAGVYVLTGDQESAIRGLTALVDDPAPWTRAAARTMLGHLAVNNGDLDEGAVRLAEGYEDFRAIDDRWGKGMSLGGIAEVAMAHGEPAEALRAMEEACAGLAASLSPDHGAMMRVMIGRARVELGDYDHARADFESAIAAAERIGEYEDAVGGYLGLAEIARRAGDLDQARVPLESALGIVESGAKHVQFGGAPALTFTRLGCLAEQRGDLDEAAGWHAKAMDVLVTHSVLPSNPTHATVMEGLAALATARGEPERAAELLGTAHTLHGFSDPASFEVRRVTASVLDEIGRAAFDAAYARGRAVTREQALALTP